jgi:ubiquitin carboxyl-terminal hydrolase 4/11
MSTTVCQSIPSLAYTETNSILDSQVHKRFNSEAVVTSAAYLLVYRRRSPHPLGPPELQELCAEHWNPKSVADSDSSSRAESPADSFSGSGKGQRAPDDSSRSGLSSALVQGVGVGHLRGGVHGSGATRAQNAATAMTMEEELDLPPPAYEEDEGIGMGEGDLEAGGGAMIGPLLPTNGYGNYGSECGWTWNHFDAAKTSNQDSDADAEMDDTDSNVAAVDGDDESGRDRLLEDFGDDVLGQNHPPSPELYNEAAPELAGLADEDYVDDANPQIHVVDADMLTAQEQGIEDMPVAEVHFDHPLDVK